MQLLRVASMYIYILFPFIEIRPDIVESLSETNITFLSFEGEMVFKKRLY